MVMIMMAFRGNEIQSWSFDFLAEAGSKYRPLFL